MRKAQVFIALFSFLTGLLTVSAGDPFPKGFFAFEKTVRSHAECYPELSASELASLNPGPTYYGYVLDVWGAGPLTQTPYFDRERPKFTKDDAVRLQNQILKNNKNPLERSHTIAHLIVSGNPSAGTILLEGLRREKDPDVQFDYLNALRILKSEVPEADLKGALIASHHGVRYQALRVYANQPYAKATFLLERAKNAKRSEIAGFCASAAGVNPTQTELIAWMKLVAGADEDVAAAAIVGTMKSDDIDSQLNTLSQLCKSGPPSVRFAIAETCGQPMSADNMATLLRILADDKLSTVRGKVAWKIGQLKLKSRLPELIELGRDPMTNVRLQAAESLQYFPVKSAFQQLVLLGGDGTSPLTRQAAVASLIAMHGSYDVDQSLAPHITDPVADIRVTTYLVLAGIRSKQHNAALIDALPDQKRPANISACIDALAEGGDRSAEKGIMSLKNHKSPLVRASVAAAVGKLDLKSGYQTVRDYLLKDADKEVRYQAAMAMGRLALDEFQGALLTVLKRTNYTKPEILSPADRANACWALSRMTSLQPAVIRRLVDQITKTVVRYPLSPPAFDTSLVRVSATWALLTVGKRTRNEQVLREARAMIELLRKEDPTPADMANMRGEPPPTGPDLRAYGYQADQFLAGKPMIQHPVALFSFKFNLRKVRRSLTP